MVNQGDFAQLTCVVSRGDRPLSITWSLKGDIINSDPTLSTNMLGTQASMLVITAVDYHHSGVYTCRAENPAGVSTYSAELQVNGNCLNWKALKYFIYRKTWHSAIFIWKRNFEPRGLCTINMCHNKRRPAPLNYLESEGRHYQLWPHPVHHHAGHTSQYAGHHCSGLPS